MSETVEWVRRKGRVVGGSSSAGSGLGGNGDLSQCEPERDSSHMVGNADTPLRPSDSPASHKPTPFYSLRQ